ncbi:MAG: phage DNA encapsidation protein [bacterium]|nr:phage DNA encapsidation protein [bacterium]
MKQEFYDGTKILSMKDSNGKQPEVYIITTNRTAGKTTWFGRWFVKRFFEHNEKFCLLYRYSYEVADVANKFFNEIGRLFFPGWQMVGENRGRGIYQELFLVSANDEQKIPCGYALAINSADNIKKFSHVFADVERILFDEFQTESGRYADNEVQKFISIHTSIARGGGKMVRYVPVFMLSNAVSIINPYFVYLGITTRLKASTKFLKGDGFILENGFNKTASESQKLSAFNRAFSNSEYVKYSSENTYLNDNNAFIEKPAGRGKYIATIKYNGKNYSIWEFAENGIIYCDNTVDNSFPLKLSVGVNEHEINYIILSKNDFLISQLRFYFERGAVRFKDLLSKDAFLTLISYKYL